MDHMNIGNTIKNQMSVDDHSTIERIMEVTGLDEYGAVEAFKKMTFTDFRKLMEGDNPFGTFSKPGQKPMAPNQQQPELDADELEIGDKIGFMGDDGEESMGVVKTAPNAMGDMEVVPDEMAGSPEMMNADDLMALGGDEMRAEIERMRKLAGLGEGDMEESATGGGCGAGGVASAATRINPASRQHSPHGKAFKSARSKSSEYKRTLSKRGPKT